MHYILYKITNLINGKIYIGVHKTDDINDGYMGSGKILKRAIEKYGIENFSKEILQEFDNPNDMYQMESQVVNQEFVSSPGTYNLKVGGNGGFDYITSHPDRKIWSANGGKKSRGKKLLSTETKDLLTRIMFQRHKDGTAKKLTGQEFKGMKHTDETKAIISAKNKLNHSGELNSQYGTCWIYSPTEQINKKIQKSLLDDFIKDGWVKGRKSFNGSLA